MNRAFKTTMTVKATAACTRSSGFSRNRPNTSVIIFLTPASISGSTF